VILKPTEIRDGCADPFPPTMALNRSEDLTTNPGKRSSGERNTGHNENSLGETPFLPYY